MHTTTRFMTRHALLVAAALLAAPAGAQVLHDGNMDALTPGTPPDTTTYAGAWGFPDFYQANAVAEPTTRPEIFTVVPTSSFQVGAAGNSLHMINLIGTANDNYHLPDVWTPAITAAPGLVIRVTFNLWAVSGS